MKKQRLILLIGITFLNVSDYLTQTTNPPPLLHREITWASQAPAGPTVFTNNPNFVGQGNPTSQIQSGEDWWYDTRPIKENGIGAIVGYIVVGFTT